MKESNNVLGDECHIIGRRPGSARYEPLDDKKRDGYDNLILLCKTHHALIDDNADVFTKEVLSDLKAKHEKRVHTLLDPSAVSGGWVAMPTLQRMESGTDLTRAIGGSGVYFLDNPHPETEDQANAFSGLLTAVQDWGDIWGDIGPSGHIDAARHLDEQLKEIENEGFIVAGGRGRYRLPGEPPFIADAVAVVIFPPEDSNKDDRTAADDTEVERQ